MVIGTSTLIKFFGNTYATPSEGGLPPGGKGTTVCFAEHPHVNTATTNNTDNMTVRMAPLHRYMEMQAQQHICRKYQGV